MPMDEVSALRPMHKLGRTIPLLMKIVCSKDRAEQVLDGKLYCNTLRYLRDRFDKYEGTVALTGEMEVRRGDDVLKLSRDDLVEPPTMSFNFVSDTNVYSMFAWVLPSDGENFQFDPGSQLGRLEDLEQTFGEYAVVIVRVREFLRRVESAARDRGVYGSGIVEYVEPKFGDSTRPPVTDGEKLRLAFQKRRKFAGEREFRFAILPDDEPAGPIILNIGDIRDIARLLRVRDIYDDLKVNGRPIADYLDQGANP